MEMLRIVLYTLALLASVGCTVLLVRGYRKRPYRLLLWSAVCFACLTVNNALLFLDMLVFPSIDLRPWRLASALVGAAFMLYGCIWDSE